MAQNSSKNVPKSRVSVDLSNGNIDNDDCQSMSSNDSDGSKTKTLTKLQKIEQQIKSNKVSKKERRLLQNRKSALKCRLKKQNAFQNKDVMLEKMKQQNKKLSEQCASLQAKIDCKEEHTRDIQEKLQNMEFVQTVLAAAFLST